MSVCMYICMYLCVCMYVCVCLCVYAHIREVSVSVLSQPTTILVQNVRGFSKLLA